MEAPQTNYFNDKFNRLQSMQNGNFIGHIRNEGFKAFNTIGIPTIKNEEWKYTGINNLFKKEYRLAEDEVRNDITSKDINAFRLPGFENANELVFINGKYTPELSIIRSSRSEFEVLPLEDAANEKYKDIVQSHFNKSSEAVKDGMQALNTSFIYGGVFIYVYKNKEVEHPVYLYNIADARENHMLAQPRSFVFVEPNASLHLAETFGTIGTMDSFTNGVMEIVANKDARVEYYRIQNDVAHASNVTTTHIRQIGKSFVNTVVVSLNGGVIRNNVNLVLEAEYNEAHMYGLYLLKGHTHVDNHTMVDNRAPNCFSNEYYKGILDEHSTGVFNGKIFVRPDAQKTNAYQSNKNILLSDEASINTKPQLEIFADDVKCSHGCTVGQLDEEALFYLRSRGISAEHARSMLLKAFAEDIVRQIKPERLREYVAKLISKRLAVN